MARGRPGDTRTECQQSGEQRAAEVGVDDPQIRQPPGARGAVLDVLAHVGCGDGVRLGQQFHQSRDVWRALRGDAVGGSVCPDVGRPETGPCTARECGDRIR